MPGARPTRRSLRGGLSANGVNEKDNVAAPIGGGGGGGAAREEVKKRKKKSQTETTDESGVEKSGKIASKKRKKTTVQNDDGFEFRPRKATRSSTRQSVSGSDPLPEPAKAPTQPLAAAPLQGPRHQPAPAPSEAEKPRPKKRAQLPPDDDPAPPPPPSPAAPAKTQKKPARRKVDVAPPPALHERSTKIYRSPPPTLAPTNSADTSSNSIKIRLKDSPVKRKPGAKFRQSGVEGRRSSVGLRGRRSSSLIQEGIVAHPHQALDPKDYYKHISEDDMEHRRMQQLLVWCGHRALENPPPAPEGQGNPADTAAAEHMARVIKEEILKEITTNGRLSVWMDRDRTNAPDVVKVPNPENEKNRKKLEELKEELSKLEAERESWRLLEELDPTSAISAPEPSTSETTVNNPEAASRASQLMARSQELIAATTTTIKRQAAETEFQVDQLADSIHKITMYKEAADHMGASILEKTQELLEERERKIREKEGTQDVPIKDLLRTLSRVAE